MNQGVLDNDLYKASMQNAVCLLFPKEVVRYDFFNRGQTEFPDGFGKRLQEIINEYRSLKLTKEGKDFLREKCYYFSPFYLDFLSGYRFDPTEVTIKQEGPKLIIRVEGPWYRTILWEVPLMADISELYFKMQGCEEPSIDGQHKINSSKIQAFCVAHIPVAEFGTRRRFSSNVQANVVSDFKYYKDNNFLGTSNMNLAMINDVVPIGTLAHEWPMFNAAKFGYKQANQIALEKWVEVYQGDLGIALPDTFTSRAFFNGFDTKFAKLFDGVRQDSGDSIEFAKMAIDHYKKLKIDPTLKTIVFSDGINDIEGPKRIHEFCKGKIRDVYGIGTWLSNDIPGVKPLNMVIKMTAVKIAGQWVPTVKLSDVVSKHTGDPDTIDLCKRTLGIN